MCYLTWDMFEVWYLTGPTTFVNTNDFFFLRTSVSVTIIMMSHSRYKNSNLAPKPGFVNPPALGARNNPGAQPRRLVPLQEKHCSPGGEGRSAR